MPLRAWPVGPGARRVLYKINHEACVGRAQNNVEINHIKQILGLQHGKVYTDVKSLRYGHLMIMTDQDHDGSHIKGLLINFLHHFFPSLLKVPPSRSRPVAVTRTRGRRLGAHAPLRAGVQPDIQAHALHGERDSH